VGWPQRAGNLYRFYLPDDLYRDDNYDGFYVVGLRPATTYTVQYLDEATATWTPVLTGSVAETRSICTSAVFRPIGSIVSLPRARC